MMNWRNKLALLSTVTLLTACGGDGAGDVINTSGENTSGPRLVERFVGIWQLSSGWSSNATDDALFVIREPNDAGRAEVLLYDFTDEADASSACYREPFGNGEAFDSLDEQVFLDFDVFAQGIVASVDETTITIEFADANDINSNSNSEERLLTTLTAVNQVESDISPICTGN